MDIQAVKTNYIICEENSLEAINMKYGLGRVFMLRAPQGVDLLEYLTELAEKEGIRAGLISVIGSLKDPVIGYFNVDEGRYKEIRLEGFYELAHGSGNISLKEDKPFVHLHVVLGDKEGKAHAGHLLRGEVYVAEIIIIEITGEKLPIRKLLDNLWLWDVYQIV